MPRPITKTVWIAALVERVWRALTDPVAIRTWQGTDRRNASKVQVDLRVGGEYAIFDGETTGKFTKIKVPTVLEYTWRQSTWEDDWSDSLVRWKLTPGVTKTKVSLWHDKFPNKQERDDHAEGWDVYFLDPMKEWLEST